MTTVPNETPRIRRRPGPKPRGRNVVPLTITVTPEQRIALEALADARRASISTLIRQFIAAGLGADNVLDDEHTTGSTKQPRLSPAAAAPVFPSDPAHHPITVAVIDDDPRIVAFVELALRDEGYRVVGWHTGAGAHDFIAREMPAMVVLDVEMETRTAGLKVLEQIANDTSLRAIPVILTSSQKRFSAEETAQRETLRDRILTKPYTVEALLAAVGGAVTVRPQRGATES